MYLPLGGLIYFLHFVSSSPKEVDCLNPSLGLIFHQPFVDNDDLEKKGDSNGIQSSCSSETFETSLVLLFHIQRDTIKDIFLKDPYLQTLSKDIQNQLRLLRYGSDLTTSHIIAEISSDTNLEVGYLQYHSRWSADRAHVDVLIQGTLLTNTVQSDCLYSNRFRELFIGRSQPVQNEYQSRIVKDYLSLMTSTDMNEMETYAGQYGLHKISLDGGNIIYEKIQRKRMDPSDLSREIDTLIQQRKVKVNEGPFLLTIALVILAAVLFKR
jgi:hypothetical protein